MTCAVQPETIDFPRKFLAGQLMAFDGERDDERIVTYMLGDAFAFLSFDLPFSSLTGMLSVFSSATSTMSSLQYRLSRFEYSAMASRRYFSLTLPTVIREIFMACFLVLVQFFVQFDAGLAIARFDTAGHRVADEQNVVFAGKVGTLDGLKRFSRCDLGLVVDGYLGTGGHIAGRLQPRSCRRGRCRCPRSRRAANARRWSS